MVVMVMGKLEDKLKEYKEQGGDANALVDASIDPKAYERIAKTAREFTSPEFQPLIRDSLHKSRETLKDVVKSYMSRDYKSFLEERADDSEVPEHHRHGFRHLGEAGKEKAWELLRSTIFHSMAIAWGADEKKLKKAYESGDPMAREQFNSFVSAYVQPDDEVARKVGLEGGFKEPRQYLEVLAGILAKEDHVLDALENDGGPLRRFIQGLSTGTNGHVRMAQTYQRVASQRARTHPGVIEKLAGSVAGKYKHELVDRAQADQLAELYLGAHDASHMQNYGIVRPKKE